jgi:beta-xylosidase
MESSNDRSRDDLERAQQQVPLGPRARSGLGPLRRHGDRRGPGHQGREPERAPRAWGHLADRSGLHAQHEGARRARPCGRGRGARLPLDWNLWQIHEWPAKIDEIRAVTDLPIWVSEVGISTFGAEEVQVWGLNRTAELLIGKAPKIHWYSLYDLPRAWGATTRHREAEGSSYYRHFYMGLLREDGTPKPALEAFARHTPQMGLCQWFHYEDHRLDEASRG